MDEVRKLFPGAPKIKTNRPIFYDTKAGIIMAASYMSSVLQYLRQQKNIDLYEETQVLSIRNDASGVYIDLQRDNQKFQIFSKKVSLACGRWIGKLVPAVSPILKEVRQLIAFWKMKNPEIYKVGKCPSWTHYIDGQDLYCLPEA